MREARMGTQTSLGRPTNGIDITDLLCEPGKGSTLTCFAYHAVEAWHSEIPKPNPKNRRARRSLILQFAADAYLQPCVVLAVILLMKRKRREQQRQ